MRIGQVAKLTGLPASAIRFYESSGLIAPAQRHPNGYRDYPDSVLGMLGLIKMGQQLGFSLDAIRAVLPGEDHVEWSPDTLLASLKAKVHEIQLLQQQLRHTEAQLNQFIEAVENRPSDMSCEQRRQLLLDQLTQHTLNPAPTAPSDRSIKTKRDTPPQRHSSQNA